MASKEVTLIVRPGKGSPAQRQFALMKARITARYKLASVPGRPEELILPKTQFGVSMGYGCKTIRVRTMVGREWRDHVDFQIKEGWGSELYGFLDLHFGSPQPMDSLPHTIVRDNI